MFRIRLINSNGDTGVTWETFDRLVDAEEAAAEAEWDAEMDGYPIVKTEIIED